MGAQEVIEEWTGQELTQCSLYGVRIYEEGAVLATHVDRMPLVSSAIIQVDQDVDEPWPIEVIGHDGKAHNVTMEPGDMVLYESHSVLHGRPFPLKGRFYANLFVHFEPTGHTLRHHGIESETKDVDKQYEEAAGNKLAGHESDHHGLPVYLMEKTPWESRWRRENGVEDWEPTQEENAGFTTGSTNAHSAAMDGDTMALDKIAKRDPKQLHAQDINGWRPIHEAARAGHIEVIELLVKHGADINDRTAFGKGGSPLYYAKAKNEDDEDGDDDDSPIVQFLKSIGAEYIEPEEEL